MELHAGVLGGELALDTFAGLGIDTPRADEVMPGVVETDAMHDTVMAGVVAYQSIAGASAGPPGST